MAERRLVSAGGAEFYVEVVDAGGPATIRDDGGVLSFDGVRATVEGIATELSQAWAKVKPAEASVAFGLRLTAKSGKLTGLVVEGGGEAESDGDFDVEAAGRPGLGLATGVVVVMGGEVADRQLRRFVVRVDDWDGAAGRGSGVLVAPGWVLTCAHVVEGAVTVRVVPDRGAARLGASAPPASVEASVRACSPGGRRRWGRRSGRFLIWRFWSCMVGVSMCALFWS